MCTQRARASSFQHSLEFEAVCPNVHKNMSEEPERGLVQIQREETQKSTDIEKVEVPKNDDLSQGEVGGAVCDLNCLNAEHKTEQEVIPDRHSNQSEGSDSTCCVDDGRGEKVHDGRSFSNSEVESQTCDSGRAETKPPTDDSSRSRISSVIQWLQDSQQQMMGSLIGQTKPELEAEAEKVTANRSFVFGYFADKLSEAYKDAGRKLQGTRDIVRNVHAGDMKVVLPDVSTISKELPLIRQTRLHQEPNPPIAAEHEGASVDLSKDCELKLPQNPGAPPIPNISGWPEGSVSSSRDTSPAVFHQRLVELPAVLSELLTFSSQRILEKLESLAPRENFGEVLSLFWLRAANCEKPIPKPACLLLSETDLIVLSARTDSTNMLSMFHRFKLQEIREVQISLAGQHIRLTGCTEDAVLAIFTYSKELTQDFCRALLKALFPEKIPEETERQPLLSADLMGISLDWTSRVPDVVLDSGLHITSRFKRVLADLLYIIHGNMDGPGKPSLANVRPLLYTSVRVSTCVHRDSISQFLLTDTHVALLREDGVFHPVPRGSSLVPTHPQFQGVKLRKRSDIRCLLVKKTDTCVVVDFVFMKPKPQTVAREFGRGAADLPSDRGPCGSWKLCFGCSSEAQTLINHLCT